jgi:hypothetical protein
MKNNGPFLYRLSLALGDSFALLLSFTAAYVLRVSIDSRPITSEIDSLQFISYIIALLPFWIFILYSLAS